jgi:hypothetical protein
VAEHGVITRDYLDYNLRDVLLTGKLVHHLFARWLEHFPDRASTPPWRLLSSASLAKAYLRRLGVQGRLRVEDNDPSGPLDPLGSTNPKIMGYARSAYFGGRTEVKVRRCVVPVVHLDFTSQYSTVNALQKLWQFITAKHIEVTEATDQVQTLLNQVTLSECFQTASWTAYRSDQRMTSSNSSSPNGCASKKACLPVGRARTPTTG